MGVNTLFIRGCVCCAALAETVHKTSSCFFHIGQISHQHFSHERSDLLIHPPKASQLGDDVLEDVFPHMVQTSTFSKFQMGCSADSVLRKLNHFQTKQKQTLSLCHKEQFCEKVYSFKPVSKQHTSKNNTPPENKKQKQIRPMHLVYSTQEVLCFARRNLAF